jgi:ComF family protein
MTHKTCHPQLFTAVFIGWRYDDIAKKLLSQFKYKYAYKLSKIITDLLVVRLKETKFIDLINKNCVLCPIPSHISHLRKRGFNQSGLVARGLSKELDIEIIENFLVRDGDNRYQSHLHVEERKNLKDVFNTNNKIINKDIVLIDDVITTGTTINRAAKAIGKKDLKAIALFRGNPHYSSFDSHR